MFKMSLCFNTWVNDKLVIKLYWSLITIHLLESGVLIQNQFYEPCAAETHSLEVWVTLYVIYVSPGFNLLNNHIGPIMKCDWSYAGVLPAI